VECSRQQRQEKKKTKEKKKWKVEKGGTRKEMEGDGNLRTILRQWALCACLSTVRTSRNRVKHRGSQRRGPVHQSQSLITYYKSTQIQVNSASRSRGDASDPSFFLFCLLFALVTLLTLRVGFFLVNQHSDAHVMQTPERQATPAGPICRLYIKRSTAPDARSKEVY
jgi:hypothetical protein